MNDMKWIKANMPWSDSGAHDYSTMPPEPDIEYRIREKFGTTQGEAWEEFIGSKPFKPYSEKSAEREAYEKIDDEISDWKHEQPEYDEWDKLCKEWDKKQLQIEKDNPTFCGNHLNKVGTLIKLEDDTVYLIGNINIHCGVCDDCVGFNGRTIIKEYKIIYEKSNEL